jgi:dihydroorotase
MTTRITIRKPDDWHLHVRDGEMLKAVLPYTAQHFGRAILMPNLVPPIRTTQEAMAYRKRVIAALPPGSLFRPLMTCYLTDETDPDDVERGFRDGVFTGVKLYPANATMEKIGMPFLMHGEEVGPDIDIFDREAVFIDRRLSKWVKEFPGLRMIMEHLSSKQGADFVKNAAPQVGGTITPYHLNLTRTDWLGAGIKPMMYAMPVIKTASDRAALRKAATSGAACYFLGTDSAPHPFARKVAISGVPGIFNAPVALATYAKVFEEEGALDKLEAFASLNGPKHYRLPPNEDKIVLERTPWTAPVEVKVAGPDERTLLYRGGETIEWQVVA